MQVRLAPSARRELAALYDYVQADFSAHGAAWFRGLQETIFMLGMTPWAGKPIAVRNGLRRLTYGKRHNVYLLVYRVQSQQSIVELLHVLHGRTRAATRFTR